MDQEFLDKHESLVSEMCSAFLENMEIELGKKYQDSHYQANPALSDRQYMELKNRHDIVTHNEFADIYAGVLKIEPTEHLNQVMSAFTNSGGSVEIEPAYDEASQRLRVNVLFSIKDKKIDKIQGLTSIEDFFIRMNAMLQIESVLDEESPDGKPRF